MEISLLCTNVPLDLGVTPKYIKQIICLSLFIGLGFMRK